MKKSVFLVSLGLLLSNCTSEVASEEVQLETNTTVRSIIEVDSNGNFKEWYPGFKQVKFSGQQDENGKRNGVWKMYSEQGMELSITEYNHGDKNGMSLVYHPNGVLHYRGEYLNDVKSGLWKIYDTSGNLVQEQDYSKE